MTTIRNSQFAIRPLAVCLTLAASAAALAQEPEPEKPTPDAAESICLLVEAAANANGLPLGFFARVIWQESRFRPDAVGPVTRSGKRAEGIAQFMPGTAAERGLLDPFDPVKALPKSAEFLRELAGEFGNLGLAAAAYNAGPRRVRDWLAGRGALPAQTRAYVLAITDRSVDDWARADRAGAARDSADGGKPPPACGELTALIRQTPSAYLAALERHVGEGAAAPWGVQLSAGFSRPKVLASYAALERRFRDVLANRDLSIFKVVWRSRGTREFYQVRVGADTRESALKLCGNLRAAGGACMVLRNGREAISE
jgi:hypothetical protein